MRVIYSVAGALVLIVPPGPSQEGRPEIGVDESIVVELTRDNPSLEGHGPSKVLHCATDFTGTLYVWAVSEEVDPFLRITAADGALIAEDGDSGGGTTPCLLIPVESAEELRITIASSRAGEPGFLELHTVSAPETEQTLAAASLARERVAEIERLVEAEDRDAARTLLVETWEQLSGLSGSECSAEVGEAAEVVGFSGLELQDKSITAAAWRRAMEHRRRVLPEDHKDSIFVRGNLAYAIWRLGDHLEARELLEGVLASHQRVSDESSKRWHRDRTVMVSVLFDLGEYGLARELQEKAIETLRKFLSERTPTIFEARQLLAMILARQGELESAREILEDVYETYERNYPADDWKLLHAREKLALVLRQLGDLGSAHTMVAAVLEGFERTLPEDHADILRAKSNLATIRSELGDLEGSRRMQEEVLAAYGRTLGLDHPEALALRVAFGATLSELGDYQGAKEVFEAVLGDYGARLSEDNAHLLTARHNLATVLGNMGDPAGARKQLEIVVQAYERTLPEGHPDIIRARVRLADVAEDQLSPERTVRMYEELVETLVGQFPADHPLLDQTRLSLGSKLLENDELERAREQYEAVLEVRERTLPDGHPDRLVVRHLLTFLHVVRDDAARARELAGAQCSDLLTHLRSAFLSPPREARVISETLGQYLSLILYLTREADPTDRDEGWTFALMETRRHLVTHTPTAREASDEMLRDLRVRLSRCRGELSGLVLAGPTEEETMEDWRATIARVSIERNRLEFELRTALGEADETEEVIEADAVARALTADSLAIGYHRYERRELDDQRCPVAGDDHLLAMVVSPDGAVRRVELGPAAEIEKSVRAWRAATGKPLERGIVLEESDAGEEELGRELRAILLDPILTGVEELVDGGTLHVCLDDVLHLVPLDALPLDEEGLRVGDRYRVRNEVSFARLVFPRAAVEGEGMLLLGDVAFDAELTTDMAPKGLHAPAAPTRGNARGPILGRWPRLLGTKGEVTLLSMLFQEDSETEPEVLSRKAATKAALFDAATGKRFLHLATHGWFAPETVLSVADEGPRETGASRARLEETVEGFAPMTLCGLCLAGANRGQDALGRVPGLLTAEELCAFDLSACELAVLSACETNVGIARAGQGILSLQSALHAAGARSAITSLWRVPDVFTMELMTAFYEGIWSRGLGTSEALWEAKKMMREQGHPVSAWAGWVLTGSPE